jgi:hypothetical protein
VPASVFASLFDRIFVLILQTKINPFWEKNRGYDGGITVWCMAEINWTLMTLCFNLKSDKSRRIPSGESSI